MKTFHLSIRTPEAVVFEGAVEGIVVPGRRGSYGILADHAEMMGAVAAGVLRAQRAEGTALVMVGDGVLHVARGEVVVLADAAELARSPADAEERLEKHMRSRAEAPSGTLA